MEKLIEELEKKIILMNESQKNNFNLDTNFLENLYSVYPFNKFEYIISHLILKFATVILSEINICMFLKLRHRELLEKLGRSGI